MHADEFIIPNQATANKFVTKQKFNTEDYGFFGPGAMHVTNSYNTTTGPYTGTTEMTSTLSITIGGNTFSRTAWDQKRIWYGYFSFADLVGDDDLPWYPNTGLSNLLDFKINSVITYDGNDPLSNTNNNDPSGGCWWFLVDGNNNIKSIGSATATNIVVIITGDKRYDGDNCSISYSAFWQRD